MLGRYCIMNIKLGHKYTCEYARTSRQKLDNEYELISRAYDSRFRHLPTAANYKFAAVGKAMSIYY